MAFTKVSRIFEALAAIALVIVLCGAAAFFLASLDQHPKNPSRMVELRQAVARG
jgi:hypothetical protein